MADPQIYAVIMAGGSGTRFWPASRRQLPKQYLAITSPRTLIAETHQRLAGLVPDERVLVVTNREQVKLVREALPSLPVENILGEPAARNTAPCVALAALEVARRNPEAIQAVLPADHLIEPAAEFRRSLSAAAQAAQEGGLITFGIRPTFPATGYGYIEAGERNAEFDGLPLHAVQRFIEKPDAERAQTFVDSGSFFWNSGMFVWSTRAILSALETHVPDTYRALAAARGPDLDRVYGELEPESVDVAVMEKAAGVRMMTIAYDWNDVGSWTALPEIMDSDASGNCSAGRALLISEDARNCIVYGEQGQLTALIGVEDLVVVHAGGATLVCSRDRVQELRRIVERLGREAPDFL